MFKKSDWQLIQKALAGSESSWGKLVKRYQAEIYNHALRMTVIEADAHDLMQEIFLAVFRSLPGFRGDAKFRTWLYRIASNRSIDYLRRKKLPTADIDVNAITENHQLEASTDNDKLQDLLQQQQSNQIILQFMNRLPVEYRCILELKFYQQFTFEEISQQLGIPSNTVKTRFYSSLIKMKYMVEKDHVRTALV